MGRETKILLGFLGMLAGVFVGVLSMKLLVPRPPAGTGPDIRSEAALAVAQERVEPPGLDSHGWNFTGAPSLVPDPPAEETDAESLAEPPPRTSRFAAVAPRAEPEPLADDVTPASWQQIDAPAPGLAAAAIDPTASRQPAVAADRFAPRTLDAAPSPDPFAAPPASMQAPPPAPVAGAYLVQPGDSWWTVAERAYGDGRLYRALFAWNRAREPRVSLLPGTRLDVPPLDRLQAAWPRLASPAAPR
jgi:5'-nucleotidase/UDP-sugar diphosphatase